MVLKFSSFTTPLGHSWNWQRNLKKKSYWFQSKQSFARLSPNTPEPRQSSNWTRCSRTHIFEASVEHLQLFFGELCLLLQLVHALRPVANGGELEVIFHAVCVTERRQLAYMPSLHRRRHRDNILWWRGTHARVTRHYLRTKQRHYRYESRQMLRTSTIRKDIRRCLVKFRKAAEQSQRLQQRSRAGQRRDLESEETSPRLWL